MLGLYDVVAINHDDTAHGIKKGQQGTIVDVLAEGEAFIVEFCDEEGETIEDALFTDYKPSELVLVTAFDDTED